MKKYLLTAILSLAATLLVGTSVLAATVSFSPTNINTVKGRDFTVTVTINPQGAKIYTAKTVINFPQNLVSVKSFSYAGNWMALTQSGYDLTDNTNGILIKSAGYPGGIATPIVLGTITFSSKASGNGTISVGNGSIVYDANSQNVLSGNAKISLAISNPSSSVTQTTSETPSNTTVSNPTVTATPTEQATPQPETNTTAQQASVFGALGAIVTLGTGSLWVGLLVLVIVLVVLYAVFMPKKKM